jgi:hypothetical protein
MNKLDIAAILVGLLIGLSAVLVYVKYASADENKDGTWTPIDCNWPNALSSTACVQNEYIIKQNLIIEKQNEQIIKLSAIASCADRSNGYSVFNQSFKWSATSEEVDKCISKLVNMTR